MSSIVPAERSMSMAGGAKEGVLNQKDDTLRKMSVAVPNLAELTADAKTATESEKKMGFREGARLYPKAIIFSFCLSLAVIMEGYDTFLIGNFYGMPQPSFVCAYPQVGRPIKLVPPGNLLCLMEDKSARSLDCSLTELFLNVSVTGKP